MARRSGYDVYKDYYFQYTKGGRKAEPLLTEKQYERVRRDYAGTGQNVSRRIVSDQMELSNKQLRRAREVANEYERLTNAKTKTNAAQARQMGRTDFGSKISKIREKDPSNSLLKRMTDSPKTTKVKSK